MLTVFSNHNDTDVLLWFKLSCKSPSISDCNTISDDAANSCNCCITNGHCYTAYNSYRFNDFAFTKRKGNLLKYKKKELFRMNDTSVGKYMNCAVRCEHFFHLLKLNNDTIIIRDIQAKSTYLCNKINSASQFHLVIWCLFFEEKKNCYCVNTPTILFCHLTELSIQKH